MPPDAEPLKVAVVEDDISFQSNFVAAIEAAPDMAMHAAAQTVKQALAMLQGTPADVLVVDLGLPDGSGIEVIRAADLLLQQNLVSIEGYFLVPYAQIAIVVGSFHAIISRYTSAVKEVERSNVLMAERLAAREAELLISHQKVREIEQRELLLHERQRLMEDMHDGLGSSLVSALRMVERGKLDEAEMTQILQGCIEDLKLTIDSMEPVETDLLLLLGTLCFRLQPRLESTGIKLRWDVRDVPPLPWLDQRHALHILRILQEAFTNIIKHADASEASVETDVVGDEVLIRISDNGRGFDPEKRVAGRGLSNQARRANAVGGRTGVQSGPQGTSFEMNLPIAGASAV